jgi:hypothetical protein
VSVVGVKTGRVTKRKTPAKVKSEVVDGMFEEGLCVVYGDDDEVEI